MKLSNRTLKILKNFSDINENIVIRKNASEISTISMMKNILSATLIEERFNNEIRLYDLRGFLKMYNTLSNPDIVNVDEDYIHIKSDDFFIKYRMCELSNLNYAKQEVNMPKKDNYSFKLSKNIINKIIKLCSSCYLPDVLFQANGSVLECILLDKKNPTTDEFTFTIQKTEEVYSAFLKIENFKFIPADYNVTLSSKLISCFRNVDAEITTYIALETDCIFNKSTIWKKSFISKKKIDEKINKLAIAYQKKLARLESLKVS